MMTTGGTRKYWRAPSEQNCADLIAENVVNRRFRTAAHVGGHFFVRANHQVQKTARLRSIDGSSDSLQDSLIQ